MNATARLTTLTRVGFAARGLLYIVIAFLVIGTGRTEDPSGALQYLSQGGGRLLLVVMAAGLIAYGIWRLSDAAFDIERHEPGKKGVVERVGAAASGLIHLLLAWQAIRLIRGVASAGDAQQQGAETALALPGGGTLLLLAGLVIAGVGVYQLAKAVRATFLERLEPQVAQQPWALWTGRAGYAARGLVFLISGWFLVRAGLAENAQAAGGMAQALAWLSSPLDLIVAVGLAGFGLFSLIEARFRVLHDVPVEGMARKAAALRR
jgi:hypothetical protein